MCQVVCVCVCVCVCACVRACVRACVETVSSKIISARLKWVHTGKKKGGWSGKASGTYVSIVCAYAPTAKAHPSIKLKFYDDLQDTIDRISHNDILVMLGDFNARLGVLDTGNNL